MNAAKPAVLVISSTVVRGAVGSRAAAFALERRGFPVWLATTVTLPWHPGHGPASRIVPDATAFAALMEDLARAPWLAELGGVLTGYLGSAAQAAPIAALIDAIKAIRPDALYLCDPVMGDGGRLYVPQATAEAIRDQLMPRADILTPNPTELAFLSGSGLGTRAAMIDAARALGIPRVAVTSATEEKEIETLLVTGAGVESARHRHVGGKVPNGTGDLFAALLLAARLDGKDDARALRAATDGVLAAIEAAQRLGSDELPLASMPAPP